MQENFVYIQGGNELKRFNKKTILIIGLILLISSMAYATTNGYYTMIKDKLSSIADEFLNKDSQLSKDGDDYVEKLDNKISDTENDIRKSVSEFEKAELEKARKELETTVDGIISQIDNDKKNIEEDIKDKVKDKIQKDLEKELEKIQKSIDKID